MTLPATDAHVWLGRWPYGPLPIYTAPGIVAKLDELHIERAVVHAPQAILYKDVHRANAELMDAAAPERKRLIVAATLNPGEVGWEQDLQQAHDWGMQALNLHPNYHQYDVVSRPAQEIVAAATSLGWPVLLTVRMQDERQQHPLGRVPNVPMSAIANAVRLSPQARFLIRGATYFELQDLQRAIGYLPNWWASIERAHVPHGVVPLMIETAGVGRLLYGSMFPFQYAESTWLTVYKASDLTETQQHALLAANAAQLFPVQEA
ncbi:MAG: amidohydrolase family protein [Anaerolineae bacterium]|nr:amidohydrolase family protein [Anaerolineae bacterium]